MLAILEECVFEFWGPNVLGEVCLFAPFAPDVPDLCLGSNSEVLFSVCLGEQHRKRSDVNDLHLATNWFGFPWVDGVEDSSCQWRSRILQEHDALQACLREGQVIVDACMLAACGEVVQPFRFKESARRSDMDRHLPRAIQSLMYIPLRGNGGCVGILCLASYTASDFTESIRETFLNIAQVTGSHLQVLQMQFLLAREREVIEQDRARHKKLAADYRSLLNDMVPPHIVDKLSQSRNFKTGYLVEGGCSDTTLHFPLNESSPCDVKSRLGSLVYAKQHDMVVILFTDIKGFTCMSECVHPAETMLMLDDLFGRFDDIIDRYSDKAYKVETIGDAYMVAFGLFSHAGAAVQHDSADLGITAITVAAEMIAASQQVPMPGSAPGRKVEIRAGLHIGCIMSGVIGKKVPHYCMFGDTVNTASRMESSGVPSKIHVSHAVMEACRARAHFQFISAGVNSIKGKGPMSTFLVDPGEVLGWQAAKSDKHSTLPISTNLLVLAQKKSLNKIVSCWIWPGLRRFWPLCLQLIRAKAPRM